MSESDRYEKRRVHVGEHAMAMRTRCNSKVWLRFHFRPWLYLLYQEFVQVGTRLGSCSVNQNQMMKAILYSIPLELPIFNPSVESSESPTLSFCTVKYTVQDNND
jgi:hypothetical protein